MYAEVTIRSELCFIKWLFHIVLTASDDRNMTEMERTSSALTSISSLLESWYCLRIALWSILLIVQDRMSILVSGLPEKQDTIRMICSVPYAL